MWGAGVEVAAAYPGTPSAEILENVSRYPEIYPERSANEKVALDVAIGAAYTGKRAAATMKSRRSSVLSTRARCRRHTAQTLLRRGCLSERKVIAC
ncbi:MAG: hypothetical protein HY023_07170 [Chloroflexi bacterium]|nr:hypothetical protein [Chloroflexota bacterium]